MMQFKQKFIEDATELIADLENDLLEMERNPSEKKKIEEVYRVMHTLKGVSGMYGFERIGHLTHQLETLYDFVREDKLIVNKEILDVTLHAVDLIKEILAQGHEDDKTGIKNLEIIHTRILNIISDINAQQSQVIDFDTVVQDSIEMPATGEISHYYIVFHPNDDLFVRGVNPLIMFEELFALGECKVIPHLDNFPDNANFDATKCYLYWEILLSTSEEFYAIEDVFLFVSEECEIHKIKYNANQEMSFENTSESAILLQESIDLIQLKEFFKKSPSIAKTSPQNNIEPKKSVHEEIINEQIKITETQEEFHQDLNSAKSKITSIRVDAEKLDELMNLVSELVTTKAELHLRVENKEYEALDNVVEKIDKLSKQFRDNALSIRLVPIENMVLSFTRLVRDLSSELGKKVRFITEGMDTELDKTIINSLERPLIHVLRNSLDHGIEDPETRISMGKPPEGNIKLIAFYSGANVFIQVQDDGIGINPTKIRAKAIEKHLIQPNDILTEKEYYNLLFTAGFSTAERVTGVSGRGVGMDVVKQMINDLRGEVEIDSEVNLGTIVTIKLPVSLSIIDTLQVKVDTTHYLIPLTAIDNCDQVDVSRMNKSSNRIEFENELLPFISLRKIFKVKSQKPAEEKLVIVNYEGNRVGLIVDSVIGQYQAVIKTLGDVFTNQEFLLGGSILGDGSIAFVLDTNKFIKQL